MNNPFMTQILFVVVMLGLFYLMIFVPEKKRKKKYNAMIDSLSLNDEIMTRGGIIGKIVNLQDDSVVVQTGPDRVRIKLSKSSVLNVTNKKEIKEKESSK
ncbi:preprotein translocase subunit YajC [Clostridium oceanicum]|uniref:Preprotein translocase subunit YajC n=1 Tax=Clostridium oceanicum TaxID=1543 RepID=A0ABP3V7U9_9CLOT